MTYFWRKQLSPFFIVDNTVVPINVFRVNHRTFTCKRFFGNTMSWLWISHQIWSIQSLNMRFPPISNVRFFVGCIFSIWRCCLPIYPSIVFAGLHLTAETFPDLSLSFLALLMKWAGLVNRGRQFKNVWTTWSIMKSISQPKFFNQVISYFRGKPSCSLRRELISIGSLPVSICHEVLGDPIRHLCELELEADLQKLPILADSIGDAGLDTVSRKSTNLD